MSVIKSIKKVRIVIPCRNEEEYIARCLQSIVECNYDKEYLSVIVSDGKSTDGTIEIIDEYCLKFPFIKRIVNEKQTTPFALNLGLKPLDFDIGIILGAHSEIEKDYVINCVNCLEENPEAFCVGGIINNIQVNKASGIISRAMSTPFGVGNAHFRTGGKSGFVDTVAFGAYRKEVFEKIGFFDDELARNQDDEFNFRMTKNGLKIFLSPDIISNYFVRASYSKLYKQYFQYGYWKVYVNKKHQSITTLRQLAPPAWVFFLLCGWTSLFISKYFLIAYIIILGVYFLLALFYAIIKSKPKSDFPILFLTFLILHFSYGSGYIKGIFHFYILNKKPSNHSQKLTR